MPRRKKKSRKPQVTGVAAAMQVAKSRYALAHMLGLTPAAVQRWTVIPYDRILDVERVTGVSRKRLRPELYR